MDGPFNDAGQVSAEVSQAQDQAALVATIQQNRPKEDTMQSFTIEVLVKGEWKQRDVIARDGVSTPNQALKAYGLRGSRPYKGEAMSNSGKRFRAIAA
jgi:hypothetical protein